MAEGNRGYRLFAGGKFGRVPLLGRKILGVLGTKSEVLDAIRAAVEFFRVHGKSRERFGDTLRRTGFPALEIHIRERTGRQE
jgi:dissimilatory sulfite reductase (desulfoviridin) alpha/beta subunit